jgi:hypothetical protein
MTPLEIHEYKNRWMPGHSVEIHSDKRDSAVQWCKSNLEKHQWKCTKWSDVYSSRFDFEHEKDASKFILAFGL